MEKLIRIKEELEKVLKNKDERTEIEVYTEGMEIKSSEFWQSDIDRINNIRKKEKMLMYMHADENQVIIKIHW